MARVPCPGVNTLEFIYISFVFITSLKRQNVCVQVGNQTEKKHTHKHTRRNVIPNGNDRWRPKTDRRVEIENRLTESRCVKPHDRYRTDDAPPWEW